MTEDFLYDDEIANDESFDNTDDFEKNILQNLYKLSVMQKTLYKMLDDLNNKSTIDSKVLEHE